MDNAYFKKKNTKQYYELLTFLSLIGIKNKKDQKMLIDYFDYHTSNSGKSMAAFQYITIAHFAYQSRLRNQAV